MGDSKMRDVSKISPKSIAEQEASETFKKAEISKNFKVPLFRGKKAVHRTRGDCTEMSQVHKRDRYTSSYTDQGKPPKGSEIQPRIDCHRSTPVPLPSKQEEVKSNQHMGNMSAVKTIPKKERKDLCPKNDGGNSAYVPKSSE
jgi:hypothetical protein